MTVTVLPLKSAASCARARGASARVAAIVATWASDRGNIDNSGVRRLSHRVAFQSSLGAVYGLNHRSDSGAVFQPVLAYQRPPREKAERQRQQCALFSFQLRAKHLAIARHRRSEPQFDGRSRQRVMLGITQYACGQISVALIPVINRAQADTQSLASVLDGPPRLGVG